MKKALFVLVATALMAPAIWAGTVYFDFTYSGPGVSASGILTTTPVVPGEYLITGVSGERNGAPITAFLYPTTGAPGSPVYLPNESSVDNLLFVPSVNGPFSDWTDSDDTPSGFVYQTADGQFNPFTTNGLTYEYNLTVGGSDYGIPIQFSATEETSEPPIPALIGAGLAGLSGLRRWRRRRLECAGRPENKWTRSEKTSQDPVPPSDTVIELNSSGPGTFGIWHLRAVWSRFYIGSKNWSRPVRLRLWLKYEKV